MSEPHSHAQDDRPSADASVRAGGPNDAPAIGAVQATVFRSAYAQVLPKEAVEQFEPDRFAMLWRDSLSAPPSAQHRVLVACAGAQVVGFAALGPSEDTDDSVPQPCGEIRVMGVHPDARRAGHGSRLLNASADTLRASEHTALATWVLAQDEATRAFCATGGLEPDGAWRDRVVGPDGRVAREVRLVADL